MLGEECSRAREALFLWLGNSFHQPENQEGREHDKADGRNPACPYVCMLYVYTTYYTTSIPEVLVYEVKKSFYHQQ